MAFQQNIGEASIDVRLDTRRLSADLARVKSRISRELRSAGIGGGGAEGRRRNDAAGQIDRMQKEVRKLRGGLDSTAKSGKRMGNLLAGRTMQRALKNANTLARRFRVSAFVGGTLTATIVSLRTELAGLAAVAGGVALNIGMEKARDQMDRFSASTEVLAHRMDVIRDVANEAGQRFTAIADGASMLVARGLEAGRSFAEMRSVIEGVTTASSSLGRSGQETNKTLQELSEIARRDRVAVDELRSAIGFMPNPLQVLADALNQPVNVLRAWQEEGTTVSTRVLPELAAAVSSAEHNTAGLSASFNRLWNEFTQLLEVFNRAGVIDAAVSAMRRFRQMLATEGMRRFMRDLGQQMADMIRQMPAFARSVVQSWDQILRVVRTVSGFLIGSAAGGLPGGIIGAIIGANKQLVGAFQDLAIQGTRAVNDLVQSFSRGGGIFGFLNDIIARVIGLIGALIIAVRSLPAIFDNWTQSSEKSRKELERLSESMGEMLRLAKEGLPEDVQRPPTQLAPIGVQSTPLGQQRQRDRQAELKRQVREFTQFVDNAQRDTFMRYRQFVLRSTETTLGAIADISQQLVEEGKVNWKELADSIISQLIRIQTQLLIVKPLMDVMRGGSRGGGGGGLATKLLSAFGMSAGTRMAGMQQGRMLAQQTAGFGSFGQQATTGALRSNVPGAASGGVLTEPGTIYTQNGGAVNVAEKGREALVPLDKLEGGGGGTKVEIINETPANVETEESRDSDGQRVLRAIVREEMAADFASRGQGFRTLQSVTGIGRRGRQGG